MRSYNGHLAGPEGDVSSRGIDSAENLKWVAFWAEQPEYFQGYRSRFELFPAAFDREKQLGGTLSGGEQQMLAIAGRFMSRPRLLLLDEPSLRSRTYHCTQDTQDYQRNKFSTDDHLACGTNAKELLVSLTALSDRKPAGFAHAKAMPRRWQKDPGIKEGYLGE